MIGIIIRHYCKTRNITFEEFAEQVGISKEKLKLYLSETKEISIKDLNKIEKITEI